MEQQDIQTKWQELLNTLTERFGKEPNMDAILFLVGVNEFRGRTPKFKFAKNEKEDLMHIGVCTLLSQMGYYKLEKYDDEGWPHFEQIKTVEATSLDGQELLLKQGALKYFEGM